MHPESIPDSDVQPMWVTQHTLYRFATRVQRSVQDPCGLLLRLWATGHPASKYDLKAFSCKRQNGCAYRIAIHRGRRMLLVAVDTSIVTLYSKRRRRFTQRHVARPREQRRPSRSSWWINYSYEEDV